MKETMNAMEYLQKEPLRNVLPIQTLNRGMSKVIAETENGVLVKLKKHHLYLLSCENLAALDKLSQYMKDPYQVVVHQDFLVEPVTATFGMTSVLPCLNAVYWGKDKLPVEADIRQLDMRYFSTVRTYYHLIDDDAFIAMKLKNGMMFGAFQGDVLMGFIGSHEEGSMGMLEILPEYRRRGLGFQLESFQINRYLDQGMVPYCQIVKGNDASIALQSKLGLSISKEYVTWLGKY